jgi:uncharacterized protein YggE
MKTIFLAASILLLLKLTSSHSQTIQTINLVEECSMDVTPDLLLIDYNIESTDKKESESMAKLNAHVTAGLAELAKIGFPKEDLKLSGFNVNKDLDFTGGKMKDNGFRAEQNIRIKVPLAKKELIGKLMESMTIDPQVNVHVSVSSALSAELETKTREALIVKVIEQAKTKALLIAKSLNVILTDVHSVDQKSTLHSVTSSLGEGFLHAEVAYKNENNWSMTSVDEIEVSETIHIVWNIKGINN